MSKCPSFAIVVCMTAVLAGTALGQSAKRNIGHAATPAEIAGWDIDVRPDGQ